MVTLIGRETFCDHIVDSRKSGYEFTLFPQIVCLWREDVALLRRAGRTIFSS